jgi:hypothetical protein
MAKKQFNNDLDSYISKKRHGNRRSIMDMIKPEKNDGFREIDEVEEEIAQMEQQQPSEQEQPKESFFKRMFKGFQKEGEYEEEQQEESPAELDEDVKKVLKITFEWINQLPPETKIKFKNSQDFVEYKAVLKKYGLVKEKEVEHAQKS